MIDLHTHSSVSDGTDRPTEVVRFAAAAGCSALALTDHDTVAHLAEARDAADAEGIRLVTGCEISCVTDAPGSMHLLVYFVDESGPLAERLDALGHARDGRNDRIVATLRDHGIDVTIEEIRAVAVDAASVGRPHIARVLVDKGAATDLQDAFDRWLAKGRPAYAERDRLGAAEAIALAHASGAVCSLAHPRSLDLERDALDDTVGALADAGLDAIECFYGRYSPDERAELAAMADRHGLAVTGGSDYHGEHKPDLSVGTGRGDLHVADELLEHLDELVGSARSAAEH